MIFAGNLHQIDLFPHSLPQWRRFFDKILAHCRQIWCSNWRCGWATLCSICFKHIGFWGSICTEHHIKALLTPFKQHVNRATNYTYGSPVAGFGHFFGHGAVFSFVFLPQILQAPFSQDRSAMHYFHSFCPEKVGVFSAKSNKNYPVAQLSILKASDPLKAHHARQQKPSNKNYIFLSARLLTIVFCRCYNCNVTHF